MANAVYTRAKVGFIEADIDYIADNMRIVLTDHGVDTPNVTTDEDLADISAGTIATSGNLSGKSSTGGVFDASDVTISGVSGASVESITLYQHTGTESTSLLAVYFDTGTGLPYTPSGGDVTVVWDNGTNKIFKFS